MYSLPLLASALTILIPLASTQSSPSWSLAAFVENNCNDDTFFYGGSGNSTGLPTCTAFEEPASSVHFNGDGLWCIDLHTYAECEGPEVHLASGDSGCVAQPSTGGWLSFAVSVPQDGVCL